MNFIITIIIGVVICKSSAYGNISSVQPEEVNEVSNISSDIDGITSKAEHSQQILTGLSSESNTSNSSATRANPTMRSNSSNGEGIGQTEMTQYDEQIIALTERLEDIINRYNVLRDMLDRYLRSIQGGESADDRTAGQVNSTAGCNREPPFSGSVPAGRPSRVSDNSAPGRPKVAITYDVTSVQEQEVIYILTHIAGTKDITYVYYISDTNLLPFLVLDDSRIFSLDECYLVILKETYESGDQWNIHYILGMVSDEDTRSTAAEYAVMLHDKLKIFNISFVYRKFQTVTIGNILDNARTHLLRNDIISMYSIEKKDTTGIGNIITKKVPPNASFYKPQTCIVLIVCHSTGESKIIQACGPEADSAVQTRTEKLTNLVNGGSSNSLQTITEPSTLILEIGSNATSKEGVDRDESPELFMFCESEEKGKIVSIPEKVEFLDTTACYMLDSKNYSGVFFWIGAATPLGIQTAGIERMENYLNKDLDLSHIHVTIMQQGKEPSDFLLNFSGWYTTAEPCTRFTLGESFKKICNYIKKYLT